MTPIHDIASKLGLLESDLIAFGQYKAKVKLEVLKRMPQRGRLILVSAMTPTPAGEGKTTTTIGLGQGLAHCKQSVCLALREPSMGPCMGIKGGATGGGKSQILPADDINLHFTGDFHAITSAHNLLAAMLDNCLHHRKCNNLDPRRILWKRVMDMNDRSLRNLVIGLGGITQGVPRESGFDITAASEIMAILCLAENHADLKSRIEKILVGITHDHQPITAEFVKASGAMLTLLKDALLPNLVQTTEGVPAFVHGGPFANIAHGCNSILATRMAMSLADWAVTEAGFGFDLGGEKFLDIKCQGADLNPSAVVLVATSRALKMHGGVGKEDLKKPNAQAVEKGLPNLNRHVENIQRYELPLVVCLNQFETDSEEEIGVLRRHCEDRLKVPFAVSRIYTEGGAGGVEIAQKVMEHAQGGDIPFKPLYTWDEPVPDKIGKIARNIYGAEKVHFESRAEQNLKDIERWGYAGLPVCIAKTPASFSDNPRLLGRPENFELTVREIIIAAGAGFLVPLTGEILRMPGLPKSPQAETLDLKDGEIVGLN